MGHRDLAIAAARRAVGLDPQNYSARTTLIVALIAARDFTAALDAAKESRAYRPAGVHGATAESMTHYIYFALGRADLARQICEDPNSDVGTTDRHWCLALAYHVFNRPVDAQRELQRFKTGRGASAPYRCADVYAQWGDVRAALQSLRQAEATRQFELMWLKVDWMLDPVRHTPEFQAIERELKFPD
jgi:hypothetical protein